MLISRILSVAVKKGVKHIHKKVNHSTVVLQKLDWWYDTVVIKSQPSKNIYFLCIKSGMHVKGKLYASTRIFFYLWPPICELFLVKNNSTLILLGICPQFIYTYSFSNVAESFGLPPLIWIWLWEH